MPLWMLLVIVGVAGAIGGAINNLAVLLDPHIDGDNNSRRSALQIVSTIILGAFAAAITWSFYGPASTAPMFETATSPVVTAPVYSLTLAVLAASLLQGFGGVRLIENQYDQIVGNRLRSPVKQDETG